MNVVFNSYDSIGAFCRELERSKTSRVFLGQILSSFDGSAEFCGTPSFDDAQNKLLYGDAESAKKLDMSCKLYTPKRSFGERPQFYASVVGYMPHVPNMVAGLPTAMISQRKLKVKQKIVTIVVAIGCLGGYDADDIADANAKILAAVRAVESGGVKVNLWLFNGAKESGEVCACMIKLKDSGKYMQMDKMAYCLVNPSMHRRHMFRYRETRKELTSSNWPDGYGRTLCRLEVEDTLKQVGFKYHYLLSTERVLDENTTLDELKKYLECK